MTAQIGELLEYRGQKLIMFTEPLEFYLAYILKERPKEFRWSRTSCWRGYFGEWKIKKHKLFLVNLFYGSGDTADKDIVREKLFENTPYPIFAYWYSGLIRIPHGEILHYVHMGYESVFEFEQRLLLIRGVLVVSFTLDNRKKPVAKFLLAVLSVIFRRRINQETN